MILHQPLLDDAAFPCHRVPHRHFKVAVYHFIRHHAAYVRNGSRGEEFQRDTYRADACRLATRPRALLERKRCRSAIAGTDASLASVAVAMVMLLLP
jgi:hypothetical protein